MNSYITLKKKDLTFVRQFKALYMNFALMQGRAQSRQRTVTGKLDIQEGAGGKRWGYSIRCPYEHDDTTWGDLLDLQAFADIKDTIYLVDHLGTQREVSIMGGQLESRPIAPVIEGDAPWITQMMVEEV